MNHYMLVAGDKILLDDSQGEGVVEKVIGSGAQAEVYRCEVEGHSFALKWYFPAFANDTQRESIQKLVATSSPSPAFLWPKALASIEGKPGFGYIMDLRPGDFCGLSDIMKRKVELSFRSVLTASLLLSDAYLKLHNSGLCYRDISFGNAFIEPKSGAILVCDNDNVAVDGEYPGLVKGTQRFMAPEVVLDLAPTSVDTDLYSLAVLLFCLLMIGHPLEGKLESKIHAFDLPAMRRLYGEHPVFIFDPLLDENRPVPGEHDNPIIYWDIYPTKIRDLFTRAFTSGLREPGRRVRESEWRSALSKLRDSILYCQSCVAENFYQKESVQTGTFCWNCGGQIALPFRIKLEDNVVMLNHDSILYPHHIEASRMYDFDSAAAEVVLHPQDPTRFGLRNLGQSTWMATNREGRNIVVEKQKSVGLAPGLRINFGSVTGAITL